MAKDYLNHDNPINLQIIAHVLSQLGSAANKMPKALTDGIFAVVVLINDYASQQVVNEIVETVKVQLQEHLDSFTANVETMRDAVEHVTGAAKNISRKMSDFSDGLQESTEQLTQAAQDITEKTADRIPDTTSNQPSKVSDITNLLKTCANVAKQQVPPMHKAIIARGNQSAKQILICKDLKSADNALDSLTEKELVAKANTTLDLMDTDSLEMPLGTAFVGAKKLRNGNILYQLGLTTSVGDPQVGCRYLVKNTRRSCTRGPRLRIRLFPWIIADPGIDFGFSKVPADTCGHLSVSNKTKNSAQKPV